jgi:hypothetical protein
METIVSNSKKAYRAYIGKPFFSMQLTNTKFCFFIEEVTFIHIKR